MSLWFPCANTLILEVAPDYGRCWQVIDGSFVMKEGRVFRRNVPGGDRLDGVPKVATLCSW
jgi:hypothetical protein